MLVLGSTVCELRNVNLKLYPGYFLITELPFQVFGSYDSRMSLICSVVDMARDFSFTSMEQLG